MKRIINYLSIAGLLLVPAALGVTYTQTNPTANVVQIKYEDVIKQKTQENFPLNKPQVINFDSQEGFKRLTSRQQSDQLRDWLLVTVVTGKGLSAKDINQSVYDLPTVRYDYMSPVANFEYGTTRSVYIGNDTVVALVPKTASEAERMDDLGHIGDRHRKDQGTQPKIIEVYEYEISPDKNTALITRREEINAAKIFSSDYGYYETTIKSQDDLENFLNQANDITFTQVNGSNLQVGGRKIHSRKYQGISVQDVAALWQADKKIQTSLEQFKQRWEAKIRSLPPSKQKQAYQEALKERQQLKLVNGSGFSLDPAFDYPSLQKIFQQIKPAFQLFATGSDAVITKQDIQNAEQGIAKKDEVPYLVLINKLSESNNEKAKFWSAVAAEFGESSRFQAARYDGDLQGTEVGMVLFYTDLLMKIWDFNLQNSTVKTSIEDFNPETRIKISSMYEKELEDLPNARLWLGPNDKGFQVANENKNILFARNTTQIYAKSSNPLRPKDEQQADASTNAFLAWWNDHYEEVARYEPQYERLNQIMKWSLVINWLNQSNQGDLLGFLQGVSVKRDNWFPDWVQSQGANLRFQHWQKVGFFEKGYKGTKTEALPVLASESFQRFGKTRQFIGGVSLPNIRTFEERIPLPSNIELNKPLIRSNINPKTVKVVDGQVEFTTFEGTRYKTKPLNENLGETIAQAKAETKFRSPDAELKNQAFTRKVAQTADGVEINTTIGDTEFGSLNVSKTGNGFRVGFTSRDMDAGYSLALRLSGDPKPILEVLKETEGVQFVMASRTQPSDYIVKLSDSNEYLKIREQPKAGGGGSGSGKPPSPPDPQMFVGDLGDNSRNLGLSWLDEKQLRKEKAAGKYEEVYSTLPEPEVETRKINSDEEARKIAQDPLQFILLKQKSLKIEIKKVDKLLKVRKDIKALRLINQLIKEYGPDPNLILRKAKVEISQGRLRVEQVFPEQGLNQSQVKQNFLDEINKQLENNASNVKRIENDTQFIYGEDSPQFNNLDFKVTVEQSIPSGSGARVYRLIPGEIGKTKLHMSGLGDTSASSHASTNFQGTNPANALRNIRTNTDRPTSVVVDDRCQNETEEEKNNNSQCEQEPKEKPVYVVITS
ncbi:hypothetical protein [Trichormus sp. NMC-1]|uniref:hypothetical protein n=1 Tax=Trichormus sp. NMC-1 TaxID=1853259 RepID=UPI0008DC1D6D|nr:hypothetical protein [Trichormus sp. NMC-1]